MKDEDPRAYLNDVGTNFSFKDKQVDALITGARHVLRESPEFQGFLWRTRSGRTP